jgi:hypothetical protein
MEFCSGNYISHYLILVGHNSLGLRSARNAHLTTNKHECNLERDLTGFGTDRRLGYSRNLHERRQWSARRIPTAVI